MTNKLKPLFIIPIILNYATCETRSVKTSVLNGLEVGLYVFATYCSIVGIVLLTLAAKPYLEQILD
jgi:hypothetical protein